MPEPSNDPINSDDPKYGNGVNAKSVDRATDACFTTLDQATEGAKRVKRMARIRAGNILETATEEKTGREW